MVKNLLNSQALRFKGRLYTLTVLQVLTTDMFSFEQQLQEIIRKAPRLFTNTPLVLDISELAEKDIDLDRLCHTVKSQGFLPVALQGATPLIETLAIARGIAILHASGTHDKPVFEETEACELVEVKQTKLQTAPVRSGQQVVGKGGDLIIISSVSAGAEVLAEGNIHVYGALRGRALAGIAGDTQARIFCHSLEAELVSIAGFYRLSDAFEPYLGPCQLYLKDNSICIEPL